MQGVTILETQVYTFPLPLLIMGVICALAIALCGVYGLIRLIQIGFKNIQYPVITCIIFILAVLIGVSCGAVLLGGKDCSEVSYVVHVDESVSLRDFMDKYTIEQKYHYNGDGILTVSERVK